MKQPFFARRAFLLLLIAAILGPFALVGSRMGMLSNRNDVRDWLPEEFKETATHRWFQKHFPHEQFILVSWDGCTLDDQRLELFAKKLEDPSQTDLARWVAARKIHPIPIMRLLGKKPEDPAHEIRWPFKQVLTGRSLVEELESRYEDLDEEEVLRRLEGSLIGDDHHRTCLVVTLVHNIEHTDLAPALKIIRTIAGDCNIPGHKAMGIPGDEIRLGGPPVDNVAIDVEGQRTLYRLAGLSAIVGLGISWLCFRSVRLTLMVFFCAILAAGIGLSSIYWANLLVMGTGLVKGYWPYGTVDAVVLSMPSLVFVLALSGAIHIVNYYHDAIEEKAGLRGAPDRAIRHAWYPCTIAALTTALGLGSLVTSYVIPISKFGMYSAWGVMATLFVIFLVLPALLQVFPSRKYAEKHAGHMHADDLANPFVRLWRTIGGFIIRHNRAVAVGCLAVMMLFAVPVVCTLADASHKSLPRIKTSVKLMKMFSSGAEIIEHYAWLEKQLGPLVPMEVVIHVDNEKSTLSFADRMRLVDNVERAIEEDLPDVGGALSAATFAPNLDQRDWVMGVNADKIFSDRLEKHRAEFRDYLTWDLEKEETRKKAAEEAARKAAEEGRPAPPAPPLPDPTLEEMGVRGPVAEKLRSRKIDSLQDILRDVADSHEKSIEERLASFRGIEADQAAEAAAAIRAWRIAHGEELWRVSARVAALSDLDYAVFVDDIKQVVEGVLDEYRKAGHEGLSATYTGLVPLVYKTQHELLNGLFKSLAYAFVLIALVMMIVLKSPSAGLLAMVPNLFPVVIVFGAMGWLGILVDVGSMMVASVALGVAVDDTIHYLFWYRRGLDQGLDRKGAAMLAYQRCATAMTQTTLIAGLGLATFCFSTFQPTQRFGTLMLVILFVALIGDLIFLPALLTGPAGWLFGGRRKRTGRKPPAPEADGTKPGRTEQEPVETSADDEMIAVSGETPRTSTRHSRRDSAHRTGRKL